uniref:SRP54-type proteins GTP-binding domain-containing protein n=1 Tax=Sexangularia sp. CB-2014 TaxID=1486929 RepID=A0A7S1YKR2_9EUKA|mmetsp:Transcript_7458/g.23842  ORF Transcript_7458/g.23842 Transcript_7458/m.23842 type:complete len:545 (+) Transcript_7458:92-1726(+)
MLDLFLICTSGGLVLFREEEEESDAIVRAVIADALAVESGITGSASGSSSPVRSATAGDQVANFIVDRQNRLIYLAVYNEILPLDYVPDLLQMVAAAFVHTCPAAASLAWSPRGESTPIDLTTFQSDFAPIFGAISRKAQSGEAFKASTPAASPSARGAAKKGLGSAKGGKKGAGRKWDDSQLTEEEAAALDVAGGATTGDDAALTRAKFGSGDDPIDLDAIIGGAEEDVEATTSSSIWSFFGVLSGNHTVTEEDLAEPLTQFKTHLVGKNVAPAVAQELCDSVGATLVGKKLSSSKELTGAVRDAVSDALTRILTPKRRIDILGAVRAKKASSGFDPFVLVFVGVNGVGKSTSLSKVCCWLQNSGLRVAIAACDTFRSGAVEQLKVHARALNVTVFSEGYNKDAATVAKNAIRKAKESHFDVVLVDTAGRMQTNAPLMQSLAKLVSTNRPDLVMFVGEALVGNEAVAQITSFSRAMTEYSPDPNPRTVDCVMLTKFDTVDDKVGAAVSMVHETGLPIAFLGVGQQYSDIRRLNVKQVVSVLMK